MLKKIGTLARTDMERIWDAKVFLQLWTKVKEGWNDDLYQMRNFGYQDEQKGWQVCTFKMMEL